MQRFSYLILIFFLTACSFPKIIVLEDTLTAGEHNDLGIAYLKQKKVELAEKEFLKAIKKMPEWDLPYFNLGNLYYSMGSYDKSEKFYKKSIKLNPNNSDAMNNLAYLLGEKCRKKEAIELIKKAISMQSKEEYLDTLKFIENKKCEK